MTSDRLFSTFSTDERLALYEYCRLNTRRPPIPKEFTSIIDINKKEEHELTEEEKLIRERNAKRRRVKYKSVHTGRNKSHTEVLREVIKNQMEMYGDYLTEKRKAEEEAALKREAEARSYEQFPHVDTRVVYDYGIDPFETIDNFEDAFNVNYDYRSDLGPKIENERPEGKNVVEDENKPEKKCNYRRSRSRERDRRARSRDGRRRRSRIRSREDQRVRSRHERRH
ncbi:uncharacterized protein LOC130443308 [Diorhabda sublineata]|uniref:uncharacterized protein LOC130443308 n=1 Tax=Diorhabda sublineata TaxID=1163346 RepID=UPI0024E13F0B|nr:uncharacterized protein LOC130443308 [Diorhabda sublineata]